MTSGGEADVSETPVPDATAGGWVGAFSIDRTQACCPSLQVATTSPHGEREESAGFIRQRFQRFPGGNCK